MNIHRMLTRLVVTIVVATSALMAPAATADTFTNPVGSSSTGSAEALFGGHYGLGEFNKSVTSSHGLIDRPAPTGGAPVLVFGDSHTGGTSLNLYTDSRGCMHSRQSWPNQLAGLSHRFVLDASCWGSGLNSGHGIPFADQVRYAESLGGLGPNTKDIFVQLGFNDEWSNHGTILETVFACMTDPSICNGRGIAQGRVINPKDVTADSYVQRAKPVIDYLRYYAPQAKIHFVGYTKMAAPGQATMCVSLFGAPVSLPFTEVVTDYFTALHRAQVEAASRLGADFIDLWPATTGHTQCTSAPLVEGLLSAGSSGAPFHPTGQGNAVAARVIASRL